MHPDLVRRITVSAAALAALLIGGDAGAQQSPFATAACPVPAGMQGYPVWARAADGSALDSAFARTLTDAVARRWEPPSPRRRTMAGLNRVRNRLQPPEPRWPDDWRPQAQHVARVEVTLRRTGRPGEARVTAPSGDRAFDRSVVDAFADGAPGGPALPGLPAGLDSLRVAVGFGTEPEGGLPAVRFAAQQSPVVVVQGTLTVAQPPRSGMSGAAAAATARYDVDASGRIVPASIDVLSSTDRTMEQNVRTGLLRARFTPAQSNCRAVPLTVIQQFGDR
jgi:TonB family protein